MAQSTGIDDFETTVVTYLKKINGKFPSKGLATTDFVLDKMLTDLDKFNFSTSGALKVDVTTIVADNVGITSPLYNGYVGVEDPRMSFSSGRLQVDVVSTVADQVYIYGSDYGSPATNYQVKTDSSGQLYVGNFPSIQAVSQSGTWNVGQSGSWTVSANQSGTWSVNSVQSGTWNVNVTNPFTFTASNYLEVQVENTSIPVTQSGSWNVSLLAGSNIIGAVTQSGTWNVGINNFPSNQDITITSPLTSSGYVQTFVENSTLAVTQSGTWTVDAVQSGTWNVGINNFPSTQAISVARTSDSGTSITGTTSSTAGNYTTLSSSSLTVRHFRVSNHGTAVIYISRSSGVQGEPVFPNGVWWWDANVNETTDLSTVYVESGSASQNYSVSYEV